MSKIIIETPEGKDSILYDSNYGSTIDRKEQNKNSRTASFQ